MVDSKNKKMSFEATYLLISLCLPSLDDVTNKEAADLLQICKLVDTSDSLFYTLCRPHFVLKVLWGLFSLQLKQYLQLCNILCSVSFPHKTPFNNTCLP